MNEKLSDINYRITDESLKDAFENPFAIYGQDIRAMCKELLERRACDVTHSLPHDFELVNVNECNSIAEVTIRDKNSFLAYGGNLKKIENPRSVYPPDYFGGNDV